MELKYKDITEKIIGAAFEVHKFLGNGFPEVIYQRALAYELGQCGLNFKREIEHEIFIKIYRILLVNEELIRSGRKSIGRT